MCGIAGLIGIKRDVAARAISPMLRALAHRGPDGSASETLVDALDVTGSPNCVTLLHTRLAILDLSPAGRQPMHDVGRGEHSQPNVVTYNGEIYNFRALRRELSSKHDLPGRTNCDTEIVLDAYRAWGEASVDRLDGMFAWCLADVNRRLVWLCRDRLGVKPLYLYRPQSGGVLFASEVRALLAAGPELVRPKLSATALESFLAQGAVWGADTIIEGIEQVEPGTSLVFDWSGRPLRRSRYWNLPQPAAPRDAPGRKAAVEFVGERLRNAVHSHLVADVPLGLFLSGGIDSAALGTVAAAELGTRLRTLCIGFDRAKFDETDSAAAIARELGTNHDSLRLTGEQVLADLPAALASFDQPTVDGFNTFFTCRAARASGLKVALSGIGGDELFGGYASFVDVPQARRFRTAARLAGPLRPALAELIRTYGSRGAAKAAELITRPVSTLEAYLLRRELFLPSDRRLLHPLPSESDPSNGLTHRFLRKIADNCVDRDPINEVSRFELTGYLSQMLLRDSDACSMAAGLELRVPLLDHRLVEAVLPLPGRWKKRDPRPKPLLLDAVGSCMPKAPATSPKRGFTFPWRDWLAGPLRTRAELTMGNSDAWRSLGFDATAPQRIWKAYIEGNHSISPLQVLALIVLEDYVVRHGVSI